MFKTEKLISENRVWGYLVWFSMNHGLWKVHVPEVREFEFPCSKYFVLKENSNPKTYLIKYKFFSVRSTNLSPIKAGTAFTVSPILFSATIINLSPGLIIVHSPLTLKK